MQPHTLDELANARILIVEQILNWLPEGQIIRGSQMSKKRKIRLQSRCVFYNFEIFATHSCWQNAEQKFFLPKDHVNSANVAPQNLDDFFALVQRGAFGYKLFFRLKIANACCNSILRFEFDSTCFLILSAANDVRKAGIGKPETFGFAKLAAFSMPRE